MENIIILCIFAAKTLLANTIDWSYFEREFAPYYCSNNGRPSTPVHLIICCLLIKQLYLHEDETRSWNVSSVTGYIKSICEDDKIPCETEHLDARMRYNDFIITRLRTMRGISLHELETLFGATKKQQFLRQCEKFVSHNKLAIKEKNIALTRSGIFISDSIMRELIELV